MTLKKFKEIKSIINRLIVEIQKEGGDLLPEYDEQLIEATKRICENKGVPYEEYLAYEEAWEKEQELEDSETMYFPELAKKSKEARKKIAEETKADIEKLKEEFFNELGILKNKQKVDIETTRGELNKTIEGKIKEVKSIAENALNASKKIQKVIKTKEIIKETDKTETDELRKDLIYLQEQFQKIPEYDFEKLKTDLESYSADHISKKWGMMPDFRLLAMGLRGDIDQLRIEFNSFSASENLWDRTGTTLSPHTASDSLSLQTTTTSAIGIIFKGTDRFIHDFHHPTGGGAVPTGENTFIGLGSGNFTMGSTATQTYHGSRNTAVGAYSFVSNTTGYNNVAIGLSSLSANSTGLHNVAIGTNSIYYNTVGNYNVAIGNTSLNTNVSGSNGTAIGYESQRYANDTLTPWTNANTSIGFQSLRGSTTAANNTGNYNTASGYTSLYSNTTGSGNVANGYVALYYNTTGTANTADGQQALYNNTVGGYNVGIGSYTFHSNKTGSNGVAIGHESQRYANDTATPWTNSNTSVGYQALRGSTTAANNIGNNNTAVGYQTLVANTSGGYNVAIGPYVLYSNTTGSYNTAIGGDMLSNNTVGSYNTALGRYTLLSNKTGSNGVAIGTESQRYANDTTTPWTNFNTSVGYQALRGSTTAANNTGNKNTAIGYQAIMNNTTGNSNTSVGYASNYANTTGYYNAAVGEAALYANTTGAANIAIGKDSLSSSVTGTGGTAIGYESQHYANDTTTPWTNYNTSVGYKALRGSTTAANNTGNYNTALGYGTLLGTTSGGYNTAIGYVAGQFIAGGVTANTTSDYSVYLGSSTKASADDAQNEIVIGYNAVGQGDNTIVFGNTSMVGAYFLADNYKTYWGAGKDASIYYDATDMVINPKEVGTGVLKVAGNIYPATDDTYYLGKNDDDTPFAYKGVILKDTTNGTYYRIEVINGSITATSLTD